MKRIRTIVAAQIVLTVIFSDTVFGCSFCRAQVNGGVYDRNFFSNLLVTLLPIIVITAIGFGLYHADKISDKLKGGIK